MATKTFYLANGTNDGWWALSESATSAATIANGWVVGTGSTNSSEFQSSGGDRASSTFTGNTVPDGTLDLTLKDALRTDVLNGTFASGNWTFQFTVQGTVQSGAADGQIVFRLIKANADGTGATEITSAQQTASVVTNVTSTDLSSSLTFNPGAISFAAGQCLFVQLAWKRTGAGGMTTTNVRLRTGVSASVGTRIDTADFTPAQIVTGVTIRSSARCPTTDTLAFTHSGSDWSVVGTLSGNITNQSFSGHSGALSAIGLLLAKEGTLTDSIYLEVRQSTFNGTLLTTSKSLLASTLSVYPSGNWYKFDLLSTIEIDSGTTYFFKVFLTRAGTEVPNEVHVFFTKADDYAGGNKYDIGGSQSDSGTSDLAFRLYTGSSHTVVNAPPAQAVTTPPLKPSSRIPYTETVLFQHSGFGTYVTNNYGPDVSLTQTISGHDGLVVAMALWLQRVGTHTDSMYLEVRESTLTGTLLATSMEVPNSTVSTTAGWIVFRFPTPVLLTAATTYWISWIMTRLASEPTHAMNPYVDGTPDTYAGGQCCNYAGTPILDGTYDLTFRLYTGTSHTILSGDLVTGQHIASTLVVSSRQPSVAVGPASVTAGTIATASVANVPDVELALPSLLLVQVSTIPSTAVVNAPALPESQTVRVRRVIPQFIRDVFRRTFTLRYRSVILTVASGPPPPPTTQAIVAGTIGAPVGDLLIEDSSGVLLEDGSGLLLEGYTGAAQTFAPTVDQAALAQAVTTVPITSGAIVRVPTVTVGPVAVTGATIAATSIARAPTTVAPGPVTVTGATIASASIARAPTTVAPGPVTVTGDTRLSTAQVFAPSVATGPVGITGATRASASVINVPSVAVGPVAVTGATRASTSAVTAPSVALTTTGATIASGSGLFPPQMVTQTVTTLVRLTTALLFTATVGLPIALVTTNTVASASQVFAPTVAAGPVAVSGQTRLSTAQVFVPAISTGVAVVDGVTIGTTVVLRAATIATGPVGITGATVTGAPQTFVPSIAVGAVTVTGVHRATTIVLFAPSVTAQTTGATIVSGSGMFAPAVALTVTTGTRPATSAVFAATVGLGITTATLASAVIVRVPTVLPQPVAVGGTTIAATSLVRVPSIAVGPASVTGNFRASTAQVFVASVTTGPVTVVGGTVASGVLLFTPTVVPGAVTVVGATRPTTIQTFTASVTVGPVTVIGGNVPTAAVLFVPALTQVAAGSIGGVTIPTGAIINAPSVVGGLAIIGVPFIAATSAVQPPSLTVGAVTVLATTRLSTTQTFAPSLAVGAVTVTGVTIPASSQVFVPSLALVITSATIASGSTTFVPTVAPLVGIGAVTIAATSQVFAPTLTVQTVTVTGTTLPSTAQIFAPVLTAMTTGATIVSGSGTFPPTVLALTAVTAGHRAATSQTFAPTLAAGPVTIAGVHRAAASVVFAPSVAVGPVTIFAPTRASASQTFAPAITTLAFITTTPIGSTSSLFTPTVLPFGAIGGPTTGSTVQLFGVTVTTGPVAVTGGTVASALQVFIPTIVAGGTPVTGGTIGTTALLYAPTTIARLDGTFIASTAGLFPPTVKLTQFVTTAPILTGAAPFAPSVLAVWAVTGGTRLSTAQTFAPSITTGPIGVIGSTVPTTVLVTAPAIGVGAVTVTVPHRASTLQVFAPTVSYVVEIAHRTSAVALFPPALATGPVAVSTGAIVTTIQVFQPSLGTGITTATLVSASLPFAPTLAPHVTTPLWIVRTQLFPPSAIPLGEMILTFLPSGSVVFPPFMVGYAPPPEILDFTSNLVREVMGDSSLDRVAEQDVVLTTAVTGDVILTRQHETSARVLVDRVLAITVER